MSHLLVSSPAGTPSVPTSFVTDSGTAIPAANTLNVLSGEHHSTAGSGDTVTHYGYDEVGTDTTSGATTADLITFSCGTTAGVYAFNIEVSAFDTTTPSGGQYSIVIGVRTDGAAATLTGSVDSTVNEEAAISGASATVVVSGNDVIVRVTGVGGLDINWKAILKYIFAS